MEERDRGRAFRSVMYRRMVTLHVKVLEKNGKKEFVILPYEEFIQLQDEIDDYEALKVLRETKSTEKDASNISLNVVRKELDIE